jgi:hypothetical protein
MEVRKERDPGTNWIRGWVGTRASLDALEVIKVPKYLN